jgi:hypothetical protein
MGRILDPKRIYCQWEGCVNMSDWGFYCSQHNGVRHQHSISHRWEGHTDVITMCPVCETDYPVKKK